MPLPSGTLNDLDEVFICNCGRWVRAISDPDHRCGSNAALMAVVFSSDVQEAVCNERTRRAQAEGEVATAHGAEPLWGTIRCEPWLLEKEPDEFAKAIAVQLEGLRDQLIEEYRRRRGDLT